MLVEPRPHHVDHGSVGYTENLVLSDNSENHVINDETVLIQKMGVSTTGRFNGGNALCRNAFEPLAHVVALEAEGTHVRNIKQACSGACGKMLVLDV